ncbi:MAG: type II secretion system F family protein [Micrococcales bacterium]
MARSSRLQARIFQRQPITPGRVSWLGVGAAVKAEPLLAEIPQQLEIMAARLQNGENIYAILEAALGAEGDFANALARVSLRLKLGESLDSALEAMAREEKSPLVSELANKLRLGIARGTPMSRQLLLMADSARNQFKVQQLKAAGRNEVRMLIPLVFVILPVTVAFAVFPSLGMFELGI